MNTLLIIGKIISMGIVISFLLLKFSCQHGDKKPNKDNNNE